VVQEKTPRLSGHARQPSNPKNNDDPRDRIGHTLGALAAGVAVYTTSLPGWRA